MSKLNIAFNMMGGDDWPVGPVYLKNIFYALQSTFKDEIRLSILASSWNKNTEEYMRYIGAGDIIYLYNLRKHWLPLWIINGFIKRLSKFDLAVENILKKYDVNAVFEIAPIYKYPRIANLSWIWDFQHLHLPWMFSKSECSNRSRLFLQTSKVSTRIILMSESVKADFKKFAPMYMHKVRVLQPVSCIAEDCYKYDLNSILKTYYLPDKFIYLPNQFWKHKNHEIAFKAVKILNDKGTKIFLVCTGNAVDSRHTTYFSDLYQRLSKFGIRSQVIYLGLVPHEHVLLLMRQSVCVLNPSLFEGWGYTVEEARAIGKQVLISDIPAHREQNPPKATFFDPNNSEDLAEKLCRIWLESSPGPDYELEEKARSAMTARLRTYAESFVAVLQEAIEEASRKRK